jgi:hypothetical protein
VGWQKCEPVRIAGQHRSVNAHGTPAKLVASHPGNTNAVTSGVFSRSSRVLEPRAKEIAEAILSAPHVEGVDEIGAAEIGRLVALIEAADRDLAERGLTSRKGEVRTIVKLRLQASRRLQEWLGAYGLHPRGRADFARQLAEGGLAAEIARRRAEASG